MSAPTMNYVAWGGKTASIPAPFELGIAAAPPAQRYGPRRALWDAAYGYVNGFPASAIAYYLLTRSISRRVWVWAFHWEQRRGHQSPYLRMVGEKFIYEERP